MTDGGISCIHSRTELIAPMVNGAEGPAMRIPLIAIVLTTCLNLSGCRGTDVIDADYDSDQAREILTTALDLWKAGQAKTLSQRRPPIRFADDDLMMGMQLVDYEIEDDFAPIFPFRDIKITLTLRDRRGQILSRDALYQVGLEPHLTVLRSDN